MAVDILEKEAHGEKLIWTFSRRIFVNNNINNKNNNWVYGWPIYLFRVTKACYLAQYDWHFCLST